MNLHFGRSIKIHTMLKNNNLWIPHIHKTGGQTLITVLHRDLKNWKIEKEPYQIWNGYPEGVDGYIRAGLANPYIESVMKDWHKILVIREPYERFVSCFNHYKWSVWNYTGWVIDVDLKEFAELCDEANAGKVAVAMKHLGKNLPGVVYENYANTVLERWPWKQIFSQISYCNMLDSLNVFYIDDIFDDENVFEFFDIVSDTNNMKELEPFFEEKFNEHIKIDVRVNVSSTNAEQVGSGYKTLNVNDLSKRDYNIINKTRGFSMDIALWENYMRYREKTIAYRG